MATVKRSVGNKKNSVRPSLPSSPYGRFVPLKYFPSVPNCRYGHFLPFKYIYILIFIFKLCFRIRSHNEFEVLFKALLYTAYCLKFYWSGKHLIAIVYYCTNLNVSNKTTVTAICRSLPETQFQCIHTHREFFSKSY